MHKKLSQQTGMDVYFCAPHSPWQRGSNENTNGLVRQYLPKGTDLSIYSQEKLDAIANEINGRPRKSLGVRSPLAAYRELLTNNPQHSALNPRSLTTGCCTSLLNPAIVINLINKIIINRGCCNVEISN